MCMGIAGLSNVLLYFKILGVLPRRDALGHGSLRAGWIVVEKGCNWTYDKYSEFLGIGTGGDSGTGGNWPYSNETIN